MKSCPSQKKTYLTKEMAEDALLDAHVRFEYGNGSGPITVYECEECGCFHFTSQGKMSERLTAFIKDGKLKRMKEAYHWEKKWRH